MNHVTRRHAANQSFCVAIATTAFILCLLLAKWAGAQEPQMRCYRHAMLQGKVNETVLICEPVTTTTKQVRRGS